ncbi:23S rRNA (uracil(1939)-C(5))-methyltransferase RlmD [Desulfosporosinus sp.]|uniref:23S rRNA (uracil(1939)-C(5))-methyltransferase RlmD n=1 Tax=Desulfosporosinus sp. TaxID=157907 RepID=UPI0025C11D1E|nr:23S rRNA (uracil(1939)-C(5))-methyltransferase RlmD [Desulfosporosinus sp.]MBC2723309.1 23S rRNA (uracil(1939)-C(5))-methyltransferase RlmD [Desulfosporosinus sp.]MBC2726111.1 23S rRNA (uracil(1939)-C(5))-methyltransferase RlmD [Desulfosporosinus sp.]
MSQQDKSNQATMPRKTTVECLRLISDGSGIGHIDGIATFVPGLLPGETAEVVVTKAKKNWQQARLLKINKRSPERIDAPCSVFEGCGGCQLQHMSYKETLVWKRRWVEDALTRIGKLSVEVKPMIGMEHPWRYRNKARLHRVPSGELGYFKERSKALVNFADCLLLSERMNRWIRRTEELLAKDAGYSEIHTLIFRENTNHEGLLLLEGPPSKVLPVAENPDFFEALAKEGIRSVWGANAEGKLQLIWGEEEFGQTILDLRFDVSPLSFLQVNSLQTDILYKLVLDGAALTGEEIVWDLYSGIGTLALALATKAKKVTGIEENPYAVENAIQNAVKNNAVGHVEFLKGKVEQRMMKIEEKPNVVVLDPPRAGLHGDVLERLLELKPERIIYVSCDTGTLARDLGGFTVGGYTVMSVQPVDMFPWTQHVECVVMIERE